MHRLLGIALAGLAGCKPTPPTPASGVPEVHPGTVDAPSLRRIDDLAAGGNSTCALSDEGEVACVGDVLTPEPEPFNVPAVIEQLPRVVEIGVGGGFACARTAEGGEVWCWGYNAEGQLGRPTAGERDRRPRPVPGLVGAEALFVGGEFACARRGAELHCWGGTTDHIGPAELWTVPDVATADQVQPTVAAICLRKGPAVECWSAPGKGESTPELEPRLDAGVIELLPSVLGRTRELCWRDVKSPLLCAYPSELSDATDYATAGHDEVVRIGNGVCGWTEGSLVCGRTIDRWGELTKPVFEPVSSRPFARLARGANHQCALDRIGGVQCWGRNERGQIAAPTMDAAPSPVRIEIDGVDEVALSGLGLCVLRDDELHCTVPRDGCNPSRLQRVTKTKASRALLRRGMGTPCFLEDGASWVCPSLEDSDAPRTIALPAPMRGEVVDADFMGHACFVLRDGTVACTGYNRGGQIGRPASGDVDTVHTVSALPPARRVVTSYQGTCALTREGQVWCWGDGAVGRVPDPHVPRHFDDLPRASALVSASPPTILDEHGTLVVSEEGGSLGAPRAGEASCVPKSEAGPQRCGAEVVDVPEPVARLYWAGETRCMLTTKGNVYCEGQRPSGGFGDGLNPCSTRALDVGAAFVAAFAEQDP